ncbi:uncharacterized protein LOC143276616 isoform X2 [Babylonia areolata]|uniref:uncharacterized protein LOC143276616 isoform X2 n=1 Tax=Babylonia areolata TaxID=304850 RepID=UPI003FD02E9A
MTTDWNSYGSAFSPHNAASGNGLINSSLPATQEERLRRSFENLDTVFGSSEFEGVRAQNAMESPMPDEIAPDYGEEGVDSIPMVPMDVSDLSSLPDLTEDAVLRVVRGRYEKDQIFTKCGDVLISVNPFKELSVFDEEAHETYSLDCLTKAPEPEPHLFWVAAQTVSRRSRVGVNQVILVSGESGAGKTEATKLMLRHILYLSNSKQDRLYESIDKVNPLIELFGNARTQLNGNSSRFAKFLDVRFKDGAVTGAIIRDYILEKSRLVRPSDLESNFHIFYSFLDEVMGSPELQKQFLMEGMDKKTDFRIAPQGSWYGRQDIMSGAEQTRAYKLIGVGTAEVENLRIILAAILHLTNIEFEEDEGFTGGVVVKNENTMRKAAALLSVDPEKLARVLVTKRTRFHGKDIETFSSKAKAEETRDAMAKALYERLFGWLVRTINFALNRHASMEPGIGFLDICGFEDLGHNSLEQLCINLANEHLQRFMNSHVFRQEMDVFQREGIPLGEFHPPDNEAILKMFDTPKRGIWALINEDTRVEIASEESMVRKLCDRHAHSQHFLRYKNDDPRFGIKHFATPVWYDAREFLEKNGDNLNTEVKEMLMESENELVSDIFKVQKALTGSIAPTQFSYRVSQKRNIHYTPGGQLKLSDSVVRGLRQSLREKFRDKLPPVDYSEGSKLSDQRTVIDCFQSSMSDLLDKMKNAHPLFIRCIKPNDLQAPDRFEDKKVQLQLRYNGVTEIARIRRVWYPVRIQCNAFIRKYCHLSEESKKTAEKKEAVALIMRRVGATQDQYRTGTTIVFLKDKAAVKLDKELKKLKEEEERKRKAEEVERKRKAEEEERKRKAEEKKRNADADKRMAEAEKRKAEAEERKRKAEEEARRKKAQEEDSDQTFQKQPYQQPDQLSVVIEEGTPASSMRTVDDTYTSSTSCSNASAIPFDSQEGSGEDAKPGTSTSTSNSNTREEPKYNFWDIFRIVAREKDKTDIHRMTSMKILKFIAYILIFVIVLVTATAQRVSLMVVVSAMKTTTATTTTKKDLTEAKARSTAYYILMMVAVCIPYMLTFFLSVLKVLFGGFRNPSLGTWIWVLVMESLHTLGLTLLVFRILPRLDVIHGLLFLTATGLFPSILKLVASVDVSASVSRSSKERICQKIVTYFLDFLAFAGQVSVFPVVYVLGYVTTNDDGVWSILDVAGAMFVSLGCWENFFDGRFFVTLADTNWLKNFMLMRRFDLQRGRYIPQIVMSVWKILLTCVLAYFYRGERNFDYKSAFEVMGQLHEEWRLIIAILVLTMSAFVCYYFAYIACKLWMQRISFVVPLFLSTPCAVAVFFLDNKYTFLSAVTVTNTSVMKDPSSHWRTLVAGVAWFLSLLLLTRHVWWPRQNRMAKFEMLFVNPLYCGILTMESLFMNRRRHALSCRKRRLNDKLVVYRLDRSERGHESHPDYADEMYAQIDASGGTYDPENPGFVYGGGRAERAGDEEVPMIYACATMWHEVRREMVALLKSLHRLDLEQWTRKQAQEMSKTKDKDYFEYEAHIFFDDAMTLDDDEEFIPNDFVKMVVEVMEEAVSSVYRKTMTVHPPIKIPTPYGGQLLWIMPGDNLLFIHLKDKAKIRHKKRWSQVMYMYYLLGFRLTRQCQQQIVEALQTGRVDSNNSWAIYREDVVGSEIFEMMDDRVAKKSQNTFVMALDGDTDFSPGSVHILLDRMKKNPKVGAACGRIHPIGSGPLVWYQMFEYAIGHWMQKATEHVLGCVLCSPGCFSLFRGSALMDDNVMRKYTILPTEPGDFLQYDQGEDRWLCTLLLQQGYRVDYAAAADAWTYAPEGFNEFFNQRRRWMPSTLANVMDLLSDYSNTVAVNSNISMLYIAYQVALMVATLLGPGTVLMMIAGAIGQVFKVDLVWSYVIAVVPAVIYLFVCLYCKTNIQLYLAALLSTFYAFVMMIVFVGVVVTAATTSIFHPSVLVIVFLVLIFVIAGLCHPMEIYCLPSGALYLLCIPSGYLLLVIYSICNLHVVSWGTREVPKKKTKAELEEEKLEAEQKAAEKAKKKGFMSRFFFSSYMTDLKEIIQSATGQLGKTSSQEDDDSVELLKQINESLKKMVNEKGGGKETSSSEVSLEQVKVEVAVPQTVVASSETRSSMKKGKEKSKKKVQIAEQPKPAARAVERNELENPKWIEDKDLGNGETMKLFDEEMEFWKTFIEKYLKPLDADKGKEKEISAKLIELRNSVVFGFSMINLLWIAINFMFQYTVAVPVTIPIDGGVKVGILGLLFVIFLLAILLLQIMGMIVHRWGTLLHLLAFTNIECPCFTRRMGSVDQNEQDFRRAFDFCQRIIREPMPDYLEDDDVPPGTSLRQNAQDLLKKSMLGGTAVGGGIGRQSVVRNLSQSGILQNDFVNSRGVNLFLRGTARARDDEEDHDAIQFVSEFRSNIYESGKRGSDEEDNWRNPQRGRNGFPARPNSDGYLDGPPSPRGDGFAPPPPRRQSNRYGNGVRRRLHANNLRYTVADTLKRLEDDGGRPIPHSRRENQLGRASLGGGRGGGGGGVMDRALSRRLKMFGEFTNEHERLYPTIGRNGVLHT